MKSYRIVLEYTEDSNPNGLRIVNPAQWSWPTILDIGPDEVVTLVSSQIIDTPQSHARQLAGIDDVEETLEEMTAIAQKYDMGYPTNTETN